MWDRGNIGDVSDLITACIQCAYSRLTTWAGSLNTNVKILQTVFSGSVSCTFSGDLSSKRCALTGTAETRTTGGGPGKGVALAVGNGHDGVVEGSVDVCDTVPQLSSSPFYVNEYLALPYQNCSCIKTTGRSSCCYLRIGLRGPLRVRALVLVRCPRTGRLRR